MLKQPYLVLIIERDRERGEREMSQMLSSLSETFWNENPF